MGSDEGALSLREVPEHIKGFGILTSSDAAECYFSNLNIQRTQYTLFFEDYIEYYSTRKEPNNKLI